MNQELSRVDAAGLAGASSPGHHAPPLARESRRGRTDGWRELTTRLLATDRTNSALAAQRVALALVMFPHGAQKMLGWFGGFGFSGTMGFFTETMGLPWLVALLVVLGEFVGPVLLVLGLGTRVAALGITAIMAGAIVTTHAEVGFFMNWFGNQSGEGFEFHLLAIALAAPLTVWGAGRASVDARLAANMRRATSG